MYASGVIKGCVKSNIKIKRTGLDLSLTNGNACQTHEWQVCVLCNVQRNRTILRLRVLCKKVSAEGEGWRVRLSKKEYGLLVVKCHIIRKL